MRYYNAGVYDKIGNVVKGTVVEVDKTGTITSIKCDPEFVGTDEDVNCQGLVLYPTFMDSMVTLPSSECYTLFGINLLVYNELDQYLHSVSTCSAETGIKGFGFNTLVMGEFGYQKMKAILDERCPDKPAYVFADDLSNVVVNEYILEKLKEHCAVSRELHTTGLLDVQQIEMLRERTDVFEFTVDEYKLSLIGFQSVMLKNGIGAIRVVGFLGGDNLLTALRELSDTRQWVLETVINVPIFSFDTREEMVDRYIKYSKLATDKIHVTGVTITLDGSVDSGQAALYEGYSIAPEWRGDIIWNIGKLWDTVQMFSITGADININAVGDRAVSVARQAYESTSGRGVYCISHAYLVSDEDIAMSRNKNITFCVEPNNVFYSDDFYEGDRIMLGDRIYGEYPVGRLLYAGLGVVAGGNVPTQTEIFPVSGAFRAARRTNADDVTPFRVFEMYEDTPYKTFGLSDKCGKIAVGRKASFVVLSQDIINIREELLCDCQVAFTAIDGVPVWFNKVEEE